MFIIGGGPGGPPLPIIPGGGGGGGGPPPGIIGGGGGMEPGKMVYDDFSFRKGKQTEESKQAKAREASKPYDPL
jgi:hypothetical protein